MEQLSIPAAPRASSASPSPTRRPHPTVSIQRTPSLQTLHTVSKNVILVLSHVARKHFISIYSHLTFFRAALNPNVTDSKSCCRLFGQCKVCYSAVCLPLGAATGSTAQSLLSAEFREKNRALNNFRRAADSVRPSSQVGVVEI